MVNPTLEQSKKRLSVIFDADNLFFTQSAESKTQKVEHFFHLNTFLDTFSFPCEELEEIRIIHLPTASILHNAPDDNIVHFSPLLTSKTIKREKLFQQDIYHYYGIETKLQKWIDMIFNGQNITSNSLLQLLAIHNATIQEPLIHIHFVGRTFYLYAQINSITSFFNAFKYNAASDVLYFITAVINELGNDKEWSTIRVSGDIETNSELKNTLSNFYDVVVINATTYTSDNNYQFQEFLHRINLL